MTGDAHTGEQVVLDATRFGQPRRSGRVLRTEQRSERGEPRIRYAKVRWETGLVTEVVLDDPEVRADDEADPATL